MKRLSAIAVAILAFLSISAPAQVSDTDKAAITAASLDYIEGWYEGNPERMERALHPDLAKRIVMTNAEGRSSLQQMSAMTLVQGVRRGGARVRRKRSNKRTFRSSMFTATLQV